jgi:hypothetical protein
MAGGAAITTTATPTNAIGRQAITVCVAALPTRGFTPIVLA